jgi:hypothetical protein
VVPVDKRKILKVNKRRMISKQYASNPEENKITSYYSTAKKAQNAMIVNGTCVEYRTEPTE